MIDAETGLYVAAGRRRGALTRWGHMGRFRGFVFAAALLVGLAPLAARAEDDPPGRVGRVAELLGDVSMYDHETGEWAPAERNRPLTGGDRIATDPGARAELQIGSTTLRLAGDSELDVQRLDDERVRLRLRNGSLALHLREPEVAAQTTLVTDDVTLQPLGSGLFRIDRSDDLTYGGSWRGQMRAGDGSAALVVDAGQRVELWREGPQRVLRHRWTPVPDDDFSAWVVREDRADDRRDAASAYVSPEMTGAEDLVRYGRWEQTPEYGAVWIPRDLAPDWAPYRYGRWTWVLPWGWTWVDDAPWGFAPFHYGRWVRWAGQWSWTPGAYVARPVYAPALVAWVGGPNFSVSISVGGPALPAVGWVPLAPFERFVPYYRGSPHYVDRINHRPPGRPPRQVPTGPVMYGNQGVPGAVTVVPRDVLVHREPVARAAVETSERLHRVTPPPAAVMRRMPELPPPRRNAPPAEAGRRAPAPPVERRPPEPVRTPPPVQAVPPVRTVPPPVAPPASRPMPRPVAPPATKPVPAPQPPQQPIMRPAPPVSVLPRQTPSVTARPVPPVTVPQPVPMPGERPDRGARLPPEKREPPADDQRVRTPESRNPNQREQQY